MNTYKMMIVAIVSLVLVGCTTSAPTDTSRGSSAPTQRSETIGDITPAPTAMIESSGDVDADFEAIEKELDSLNIDTDFPALDAEDLSTTAE